MTLYCFCCIRKELNHWFNSVVILIWNRIVIKYHFTSCSRLYVVTDKKIEEIMWLNDVANTYFPTITMQDKGALISCPQETHSLERKRGT